MLTILEGSTFCISDDRGDIATDTSGLFAHDTRFLSRLVLTVGGSAPLLLSSGRVEHFRAAFYLRNGTATGLPRDSISIARERFVGTGMQERIALRNESPERLEIDVALEAEADFADIISVKHHDFSLGDPDLAQKLPPPAPTTYDELRRQVSIVDPHGDLGTQLVFSKPGRIDGNAMTFALTLDPHERWELSVDVLPWLDEELETFEHLDEERESASDVVAAWTLRVPRVRGGWENLRRSFDRSIGDLAALRMRTGQFRRPLFAAGMPWFMTVFGRDTAITSLQTLLLGPEIAMGALDALTELQAHEVDTTIDAEPGKIVHEVREGRCAETWFPRYYGSIDSTPLYLVLLAETWRWTDDASFAQRLREPALLALEWIDRYGDRDGDGFVEYSRMVDSGLANQSWKDSGDSQRFQDGSFAEAPIAAVEVQGYVVRREARSRRARARGVARPGARRAARARGRRAAGALRRGVLGRRARRLLRARARREEAPRRLAQLEHGPSPVERDRAPRSASPRSSTSCSPKSCGRAGGSARWRATPRRSTRSATTTAPCGPTTRPSPPGGSRATATSRRHGASGGRLIEAAAHFDWSLPEVFAGYARDETPFPIAYPTAARPQAWAAGTPILLVRILLGIEPDRERQRLVSTVTDELPSWLDGLRIEGVRAYGRTWTVAVERGHVTIAEGV